MDEDRAALRSGEILQATIEQLIEHGIASFRVKHVASALGISSGLVHYHFETKDRLIVSALRLEAQHQLDELARIELSAIEPRERLLHALRLYGPTGTAIGWRLWIDAWSESLRNDALRDVMQQLNHEWTHRIATMLHAVSPSKGGSEEERTSNAARLLAWLDGESVRLVLTPPQAGSPSAEEQMAQLLRSNAAGELIT